MRPIFEWRGQWTDQDSNLELLRSGVQPLNYRPDANPQPWGED